MVENRIAKKGLWFFLLLLVVLAWIFGLFIDLTGDSGLYAAISRQMTESGNWLSLKINGEPYDQKPHLFFWLAGLGIQLFGNTNFAYKLFPFLFAVAGICFTYRLGRVVYGKSAGKLAALITGTSQMFFLYLFDFHTDSVLYSAVVLAIWQFAEYFKNQKKLHFILGFAGVGLAMLTKGPVGAVLPFFFVLFQLILKKDFRQLFHPKWLAGILLVLLIISPALFHLWKNFGVAGIRFYFIDNNLGRVSGKVAGSSSDPFYYIYNLLWAFLPWTIILLNALFVEVKSWFAAKAVNKTGVAIFGSVLVLLVVYSIARGKAPNYVMMFIPLLSVIAAGRLQTFVLQSEQFGRKMLFFQLPFLIFIVFLLFFVAIKIEQTGILAPILILSGILLLAGLFFFVEKNLIKKVLFFSVAVAAGFNLYLNVQVIPRLFEYQGYRQALEIFESEKLPGEQLYNFGLEEYALFFYAKEHVGNITTWEQLHEAMERPGTWLYTNEIKYNEILHLGFEPDTVFQIKQRGMNRITWQFLNPATREESLKMNWLLKTKSKPENNHSTSLSLLNF